MNLVERLNQAAQEIAQSGHDGWGNLMMIAAEEISSSATNWQPTAEMWANVPEWAMWCVAEIIRGQCRLSFWENEPIRGDCSEWGALFGRSGVSHYELPLGIDWRLAKWRRPK